MQLSFLQDIINFVSMLGQGYQKLFFCGITMVFLQSYVIMSGGHLWETENKRI